MDENTIINSLVQKARAAANQIVSYSQEQIDDVCFSIGWEMYKDENLVKMADLELEETTLGLYDDKLKKHKGKVMGAITDITGAKTVGLIEKDEAKGISKYAKPIGVVGALCPITNPTVTPASNAIAILKGRNAVIFAPHPGAKKVTALSVELMRDGLRKVGAPEDLIQVIEEPSIELTNTLMRSVDLIVATGGAPMVKAAYSSGTPAYGVGPGNSCQIVAEDANISDTADKVMMSKTFDHATSCSSENSLVIHKDLYDKLLKAFEERGCSIIRGDERAALKDYMWQPNKKGVLAINPKMICRSAERIAEGAGIKVPDGTRVLIVEGEANIENDKFAEEKLSPVLTVYKYSSFEEALSILIRLTDNCGLGHSCGIHTFNKDYIEKLSLTMNTSRILVRQPQAQGNGGAFFNGMPSTTTLGCGTWGGAITTENIHYKHFINVTWVSEPVDRQRPADDEVWGKFWEKHGK